MCVFIRPASEPESHSKTTCWINTAALSRLAYLAEAHLLLADGALVREVLEGGGQVPARLHRLQHVSGAESVALHRQQALEHGRLLTHNSLWHL